MRGRRSSSFVLFGPAGTLHWLRGWAFLGLILALSLATAIWLWRFDKGLFAERAASPLDRGQSVRDLRIIRAILALLVAWLVVMSLDAKRFHWSHAPDWTLLVGALMVAACYAGVIWVLRVNRFASVQVKLQPERGQTVISDGPYRFVRHPMYTASLLFFLGAPLMLGSWWGFAFVPALVALFGMRALAEEDLLRGSLAGYDDYTRRVRWRLAPGVW